MHRHIPIGLRANGWRVGQLFFPGIAHGMGQGFHNPGTEFIELVTHGFSLVSLDSVSEKKETTPTGRNTELSACAKRESATATTLLSFALVLLDRGLVVTQTLEVSEDPCFRDLTLESARADSMPSFSPTVT